jgi:hypothetical protein
MRGHGYEVGMLNWRADVEQLRADRQQLPDEQVPVIALVGIYVVTHPSPEDRTVRDWRQTVLYDGQTIDAFKMLVPGSTEHLEDDVRYPITSSAFYPASIYRHQISAMHTAVIDGTVETDTISGAEEYLALTAGYAAYNHAIGFQPLHINMSVARDPLRQFFPASLDFIEMKKAG